MKKYLLSLLVWFVWLISFCSAWSYTFEWVLTWWVNSLSTFAFPQNWLSVNLTIHCDFYNNSPDCWWDWYFFKTRFWFMYIYWSTSNNATNSQAKFNDDYMLYCSDTSVSFDYDFSTFTPSSFYSPMQWIWLIYFNNFYLANNFSVIYSCVVSWSSVIDWNSSWWWSCPICPEVDTWAILSGYVSESLLTSCQSSLSGYQSDLASCQSDLSSCQSSLSWYNNTLNNCSNSLNSCNTNLNNCLQSNCWDIEWSALYINEIQHQSAPIINITIPEEYNWDYTWDENSFDVYVEW